ncbi:aldo/keto reductase, partial [Deinococcus pimensis]|uniref:aldo/keto reductase n=1 Tax=Deinococcus pimensis TaxID=309888 RepID=UPI0005EBE501
MIPPAFTRELGHTGVPVSRLGLGLAALGRPGYFTLGHAEDLAGHTDVDGLRARAHEVLDAALAAGVRYFDAARSYGLSERFLREWLEGRGLTRAEVSVGSKWGYTYVADWRRETDVHEVKDHSLANLERQWPLSREELGPWLRVYMVHSVTPDSPVLHDAATLERLAALAREGVAVGLSVSGPAQADT